MADERSIIVNSVGVKAVLTINTCKEKTQALDTSSINAPHWRWMRVVTIITNVLASQNIRHPFCMVVIAQHSHFTTEEVFFYFVNLTINNLICTQSHSFEQFCLSTSGISMVQFYQCTNLRGEGADIWIEAHAINND